MAEVEKSTAPSQESGSLDVPAAGEVLIRTPSPQSAQEEESVLDLLLGVVAEHDTGSPPAVAPKEAEEAAGSGGGAPGGDRAQQEAPIAKQPKSPADPSAAEQQHSDDGENASEEHGGAHAGGDPALAEGAPTTRVGSPRSPVSSDAEETAQTNKSDEGSKNTGGAPGSATDSPNAASAVSQLRRESSYADTPPPVRRGSPEAPEAKPTSKSTTVSPRTGPVLTRQRSSSLEGSATGVSAAVLAARALAEHRPSTPPAQRRGRSTTSSQLERPAVAARGWSAILEEEKRENMAVVRSFGNYRVGEILGKGGYGKVYQGLNSKTGELVAIKEVIMRDREFVLEQLPLILSEIKLHQSLNHPNIVRYIDFHRQGDKSLYIILELLEGGSLKDLLKRYSFFPEPLAAQHAYQILLGLQYLHDRDILHRDIKGANVLLSKDGNCKLADFGLALHLDQASLESATPLGTSYWMAPEIFCMESPEDISKASDVWSFGCTLMELLTGHPPYHHMKPVKAMFQILESDYPPMPPNATPDLRDFLHSCFHKDPKNRATVEELLTHRWIMKHTASFRARMAPLALSDITAQELLSFNDTTVLQLLKASPDEARHPLELSQEKRYEVLHSLRFKNRLMLEAINELLHRRQMLGNLDENQFSRLLDAVRLLEKNFVTADDKLAHLVYGEKLAINQFCSGHRGVLLTKKAAERRSKWHKRWILLKDNFLFLYDSAEQCEPVDVILLSQPLKIVPAAERDVGKKFCFQVTTRGKSWFFAAANGQFMVKWLSDLSAIKNWYDDEVSTAPPLPQPLSPRKVMSLTHSRSEEKSFDSDADSPPNSPKGQGAHEKIAAGVPTQVSTAVLSTIASDGTIPVQRKPAPTGHSAEISQTLAGLVKRTEGGEPLVIDLNALRKQREKDEKRRQKGMKKLSEGSQTARAKHTTPDSETRRNKSSDHSSSTLLKMAISNSPSSDAVSSLAAGVSPEVEMKTEKDRKWGREALKRALSMSEPSANRDSSPSKRKPSSLKRELSAKRLSSMIGFRARSRASSSSPTPVPVVRQESPNAKAEAEAETAAEAEAVEGPVDAAAEEVAGEEEAAPQVRIAKDAVTIPRASHSDPKKPKGSLGKTLDLGEEVRRPSAGSPRMPLTVLDAPRTTSPQRLELAPRSAGRKGSLSAPTSPHLQPSPGSSADSSPRFLSPVTFSSAGSSPRDADLSGHSSESAADDASLEPGSDLLDALASVVEEAEAAGEAAEAVDEEQPQAAPEPVAAADPPSDAL